MTVPPFAIVPTWAIRDLPPAELRAYAALCAYRNNDTGLAWPANSTLAELLGLSEPRVRSLLAALRKRGLIEAVPVEKTDKKWLVETEDPLIGHRSGLIGHRSGFDRSPIKSGVDTSIRTDQEQIRPSAKSEKPVAQELDVCEMDPKQIINGALDKVSGKARASLINDRGFREAACTVANQTWSEATSQRPSAKALTDALRECIGAQDMLPSEVLKAIAGLGYDGWVRDTGNQTWKFLARDPHKHLSKYVSVKAGRANAGRDRSGPWRDVDPSQIVGEGHLPPMDEGHKMAAAEGFFFAPSTGEWYSTREAAEEAVKEE